MTRSQPPPDAPLGSRRHSTRRPRLTFAAPVVLVAAIGGCASKDASVITNPPLPSTTVTAATEPAPSSTMVFVNPPFPGVTTTTAAPPPASTTTRVTAAGVSTSTPRIISNPPPPAP